LKCHDGEHEEDDDGIMNEISHLRMAIAVQSLGSNNTSLEEKNEFLHNLLPKPP